MGHSAHGGAGNTSPNREKIVSVQALHLPWVTELTLEGATFVDLLLKGVAGNPGYLIGCDVLGAPIDDVCLFENGVGVVSTSTGSDVDEMFREKPANADEAAKCNATTTAEEGLVTVRKLRAEQDYVYLS